MQLNPWAYEKCYESVAKVYSFLGAEKRLGHHSRMGEHAVEVYALYGQSANLQFDSPEELNRISKKMQKDMMHQLTQWSGAVAPGPQKTARRKEE